MLDMLSLAHLSDHMRRLSGKRQDEESFYRENAGYPWAGLVRRLKGWFAAKASTARAATTVTTREPLPAYRVGPPLAS